MPTRRNFLKQTAAAVAVTGIQFDPATGASPEALPWYRRLTRWGQVNITEKDPEQYDIGWWRKYWKKTNTQGVIINAGGIVAYYPSKIPLHNRPLI